MGSIALGVVLSNLIDTHTGNVYSWQWLHHVMLTSGSVILLNELTYIKQWLDTISGNGNKTAQ